MDNKLQQFKIVDKSFKINNTGSYNIYIRLTKNSLSYSVFDISKKTYIVLANYENIDDYAFAQICSVDEILLKPYNKTVVILSSNANTLIPTIYFDKNSIEDYSRVLLGEAPGVLYTNNLTSISALNLCKIDIELKENIDKLFPSATLMDEGSVLINSIVSNSVAEENDSLYIHVENNIIHAVVIRSQSLIFYNRFEYSSSEEFIYYPIMIKDKLHIDSDDAMVYISGKIRPQQENYILIHQYFRNIKFLDINSNKKVKFSKDFSVLPQQYFYTLIALELCE